MKYSVPSAKFFARLPTTASNILRKKCFHFNTTNTFKPVSLSRSAPRQSPSRQDPGNKATHLAASTVSFGIPPSVTRSSNETMSSKSGTNLAREIYIHSYVALVHIHVHMHVSACDMVSAHEPLPLLFPPDGIATAVETARPDHSDVAHRIAYRVSTNRGKSISGKKNRPGSV